MKIKIKIERRRDAEKRPSTRVRPEGIRETEEKLHSSAVAVERRLQESEGAEGEIPEKKELCLADKIRDIVDDLRFDIDAIIERDPASRSRAEAALLYSGFHALVLHRVAHAFNEHGAHFTARLISQGARFLTGIEIHPGATIGRGLLIDHGSGVVIGETAIVGDNCTIYQGVTLGGTGKDTGKRHPTLGNNVMVGAGAKILGNFEVGDNVKIAAGAVVLGPVPENSTAVGIPAKIVRRSGEKISTEADLDQTHIPDPVSQQLCALRAELDRLKRELGEFEKSQGFDRGDNGKTIPNTK